MMSWLVWGASILSGLFGASTGVGGGLILIPALTGLGIDIKRAIAVSALSVVVVSNSAAAGYVRRHLPNLKVDAYLEVYAVLGSLVSALFIVAAKRRPLFFLCGSLLLLSGLLIWRRWKNPWKPVSQQEAWARWLALEGSYYDDAEQRTIAYRARRAGLGGLLTFGAGIGVGSGAFTVLIQNLIMGLPPKVSVTTSNLIIGVMALAGVSVYLEAGLIDLRLAVPVILGVPIGALLGSKLLVGVTNHVVRLCFLAALIALAIQLLIRGYLGLV